MRKQVRQEILDTAGHLFYREGIRAVAVDRIIAEANVAKATMYRHFPTKEVLVAEYLRMWHEKMMGDLLAATASINSPREQIEFVFDSFYARATKPGFRGCLFVLAVGECGEISSVRSIAQQHKQKMKRLINSVVESAQIMDDVTADHINLLYDGALVNVSVNQNPEVIHVAKSLALAVFDRALEVELRAK